MGVTIIFYVQNVADYLCERQLGLSGNRVVTVKFAGLSTEGKILLPVEKRMTEEENSEAVLQKNKAYEGSEGRRRGAIENLTLEDMDTYSMISRRIAEEDVFSIVSTYFMPCGVECDITAFLERF